MIKHDSVLFENIYGDTKKHFGEHYSSLWKNRVKRSEYVIRNFPEDVENFRAKWSISKGYVDGYCVDPIDTLSLNSLKERVFYRLAKTNLGQRVLAFSRNQCERIQKDGLKYKSYYYESFYGDILKNMVDRMGRVETLDGGSWDYAVIDGHNVSIRHIYTLLRLYDLEQKLDLKKVETVMEIGGGFGVNVESMLELYPNIRKYVLIDIPSCLYVATLYLKSKFQDRVIDYSRVKDGYKMDMNSSEKEIYAIPPWSLDTVSGDLDLFINLFSFQVFDEKDIAAYSEWLERSQSDCHVWLGGYEVPSSLTQDGVLNCFKNVEFKDVPFTEKDKHGDTTWFSLGHYKHD